MRDLVHFLTALIMYKATHKTEIQFEEGTKFKNPPVSNNTETFLHVCVWREAVEQSEELKRCPSMPQFKLRFKNTVFAKYREEAEL